MRLKMNNRPKSENESSRRRPLSLQVRSRLHEGLFLIAVACAMFLFISLFTYHAADPGWSNTGFGDHIANSGGRVGAWIADVFLSLFGVVGYLFPGLLVLSTWLNMQKENHANKFKSFEWIFSLIGWILLILASCGLATFYIDIPSILPVHSGGIIGDVSAKGFCLLFNQTGSTLLFLSLLLCGVTLVTGLSWLGLLDLIMVLIHHAAHFLKTKLKALFHRPQRTAWIEPPQQVRDRLPQQQVRSTLSEQMRDGLSQPILNMPVISECVLVQQHHNGMLSKIEKEPREKKKIEIDPNIKLLPGSLPSLSMLNPPPLTADKPFANVSFEELSLLVEQRLADFGIEVKVVAIHPGPVITRFELDLAPGIKVSKITSIVKDIARSLSTVSVRIVEVIPGKSLIGLEIPNENRELVTLRELLETPRYSQSRSPVTLVLGKDIAGNPQAVDLTKMPHLLVAGTTGSGKSVSLNAMLLSMLFKSMPDQLRLILIDPKMLELSVYDGIPHLLTPVITDMKDAANALRWCVAEMDKRYRLMASLGVRNITGYNQKVNEAAKCGQPLYMPGALVTDETSAKTELSPLPLIVVIIDELADMMMVVGKKVEDLIARIAQKARAAGIHLIIATQRPSVDVITGLIKANIPTRIAFQVSSRIDSRTILDQQGAEQLLGHGDMLYLPPGAGIPMRVHGAYVADDEVHRVVAAWRSVGEPSYLYEVTEEANIEYGPNGENGTGEQDPLYDEAVRIVTESRRASISLVQRRLRIGYNRAARMMEEMEGAGVVSAMDTSGMREVLASSPIE